MLQKDIQSTKVEQFAIFKDLDQARSDKVLLLNHLENIETKLVFEEPGLSNVKANERKRMEKAMQDRGIMVLDVIKNIHLEW